MTHLDLGPAHPAAHGVLSLGLSLAQERILGLEILHGMLARGSEKISELKPIGRCLNFLERLDYVSIGSMEFGFSIATECFIGILTNFTLIQG